MNSSEPPNQPESRILGVLILFALTLAVVDLAAPAVFDSSRSAVFPGLVIGIILGQFGLLAAWGILGPQHVLLRWPATLIVGMGFAGLFVLGMGMTNPPVSVQRAFAQSLFFLPAVFLSAQFPLWILKTAIGLRITRGPAREEDGNNRPRQFHLQDVFLATAAVALALGLARLGMSFLSRTVGGNEPEFWLSVCIACLVSAVGTSFFVLPCLWAVFPAVDKGGGCFLMVAYAAFLGLMEIAVLSMLFGGPVPAGEVLPAFLLVNIAIVSVLLAGLHLARYGGHELHYRIGRKPPEEK